MRTKLLRIDRSRWLRGEPQRSYLRSAQGDMCVVWTVLICPMEQTDAVGDLIGANDDESLSEPEREAMIRRIFADHGVEVEFVDEDGSALP